MVDGHLPDIGIVVLLQYVLRILRQVSLYFRALGFALVAPYFVLCWLHHCTYRSEEQLQNDRKFITLKEKNLLSSSSQDPTSTGKLVAVFSSQNRLNQDISDRDEFSLRHQQVFGSNELLTRFSKWQKSLLDGNRGHLLAEARSELMTLELMNFSSKLKVSDRIWRTPISDM